MRPSGSTPAVGSSRNATSGRPTSASREGEPLLLAAREMAPGGGRDGAQADQVEQLVRGSGIRVVAGEEVEDPARPEHRVHATALEHDTDAARERGVVGHGIQPEDPYVAGDGPAVALERLDRRRLARAVGPQYHDHLSGLGGEVDVVDRGRVPGGP